MQYALSNEYAEISRAGSTYASESEGGRDAGAVQHEPARRINRTHHHHRRPGVVVIDNTGPMVDVMMRVGAGQILEDEGRPGEGGDAIKIRLGVEMERESLEYRVVLCFLTPCMRHTHALQPRLHIRLLSQRKRST